MLIKPYSSFIGQLDLASYNTAFGPSKIVGKLNNY